MNRMRVPHWCRSKYVLAAALVVWVIALIWVPRLFPHRPVARTGIEVILLGALLAYMVWFDGWRKFLLETLPYFVIIYAALAAIDQLGLSNRTISGSFYSLLVLLVASILYVVLMSLVGAIPKGDPETRESWTQIWAELRAICARWPSWARVRAEVEAQRLIPKIVWVQAAELAGVVEYDSMHFAGMRVEECSDDWVQQISEVKTDDDGHFALPRISDDPTHWVRISWPGTHTVHLRVDLSPDAPPLHVRLKYRIRTTTNYWPGPPIERPNSVRNN